MKGGHVRYRHGSDLKHLSLEGIFVEKRMKILSLSGVIETSATSESGINIKVYQDGVGIGVTEVVGVVVGKGGYKNKGVPHGQGRRQQQ